MSKFFCSNSACSSSICLFFQLCLQALDHATQFLNGSLVVLGFVELFLKLSNALLLLLQIVLELLDVVSYLLLVGQRFAVLSHVETTLLAIDAVEAIGYDVKELVKILVLHGDGVTLLFSLFQLVSAGNRAAYCHHNTHKKDEFSHITCF